MNKNVHINSIETYYALELQPREKFVLTAYQIEPTAPLTDRQVKEILHLTDMNECRPRITSLVDRGILVECGRMQDYLTHKWVRLTKLFNGEHQLRLF